MYTLINVSNHFIMPMSLIVLIGVILLSSIRQVQEYERGVKFTIGKFSETVSPGWRLVLPIIQGMQKVDIRTKAVDVPDQEAIPQDEEVEDN